MSLANYLNIYTITKIRNYGDEYYLKKEQRIIRLAKERVFKYKLENDSYFIDEDSINEYIEELRNFYENHVEVKTILKEVFGYENTVEKRANCKQMLRKTGIDIVSHKYIPKNKSRDFITVKAYETLINTYMLFDEFYEHQGNYRSRRHLLDRINKHYSEYIIKFGRVSKAFLIKKELLNHFKDNRERKRVNFDVVNEEVIDLKIAKEAFNITKDNFYQVLKEYNIRIYVIAPKKSVIKLSDYKKLKDIQTSMAEEYFRNYISYSELASIFISLGLSKVPERISKVQNIIPPSILRYGSFKNVSKIYKLDECNNIIKEVKLNKEVEDHLATETEDFIDFFYKSLEILGLEIVDYYCYTEELWINFVKNRIVNIKSQNKLKRDKVHQLAKLTIFLFEFLKGKVLESYSLSEIYFNLFGPHISEKNYHIYILFIKQYNQVLISQKKRIIKLSKERIFDKPSTTKELDIYEVEEYINFKYFIKSYEIHKKYSLKGLYENELLYLYKSSNLKYVEYTDYWLYCLLHLENVQRPSTVTQFPECDYDLLVHFNINSINDLQNLVLQDSDITFIVNLYKQYFYKHNKNQNEGPLLVSKTLNESFAWAVLFNTLKKRILNLSTESLINFKSKNNKPSSGIVKVFEELYGTDFIFESYKFNRTVMTFINTINRTKLDEETLDLTMILRAHLNKETTAKYIKIPQRYMDELVESLFDIGAFGYVYKKLLYTQLEFFGESKEELTINELQKFKELFSNIFGSIYKFEKTLNSILIIDENKKSLQDELSRMSEDEISSIKQKISLNALYSKQKNYFCLFSKCKFKIENQCDLCPFSIITFYEITTILENFFKNIKELFETEELIWERMRLYNLILNDLEHILYFRQEYGDELLEYLTGENISLTLEKLASMSDPLIEMGY